MTLGKVTDIYVKYEARQRLDHAILGGNKEQTRCTTCLGEYVKWLHIHKPQIIATLIISVTG